MKNGDLDSKGFLASIVESEGTMESFKVLYYNFIICTFSGLLAALSFTLH